MLTLLIGIVIGAFIGFILLGLIASASKGDAFALNPYLRHLANCEMWHAPAADTMRSCTCGLAEILEYNPEVIFAPTDSGECDQHKPCLDSDLHIHVAH